MVHAAFLFVAHESKSFAMPAGVDAPAVSIKFMASPKQPTAEVTPVETPPVEQAVVPPPPPPVEPPPVKKVVKKAPIKKPKPIEKKPEVKQVTKKPTLKKQPPKPQPKKAEPKPVVEKKMATKAEPKEQDLEEVKRAAAPNAGATRDPVLVERPSFLTKPRPPNHPIRRE